MATATFTLQSQNHQVDALPSSIIVAITDPNGAPMLLVTVASGNRAIPVSGIIARGTYDYSIVALDGQGKPVAFRGVPYPIITGQFINP